MLRLLLLTLILANGLYFAWSQGLLRAYGFAPAQQSEPQRLAQQIRPEALQIVTAAERKRLEEQARAATPPSQCLLAAPFTPAQAEALRPVLQAGLPEGSWQLTEVPIEERWIIYMGRYIDAAAMEKKRAELAALKVEVEVVRSPGLELGLSLGSFPTKESADGALEKLTNRGIRTARVVQERPRSVATELRLPNASEDILARMEGIKPQLAGVPLRNCSDSGR
jgi:cell division protein FtsN